MATITVFMKIKKLLRKLFGEDRHDDTMNENMLKLFLQNFQVCLNPPLTLLHFT